MPYRRQNVLVNKNSPPTKPTALPTSELKGAVDELNKQFAVVLRGSQVLIMRHWTGDDGVSQLRFFDKKGFDLLMANKRHLALDGKSYPLGKLWLESPQRKEYEDVYFRPCDKDYPNRYNLWQGFAVKAEKDAGSIEEFLSHIKDNICQGDIALYQWVMAFLADLVQKPYRKSGTALVLRGEMGIGKGAFAYHVGKLFGVHFLPITQSGQLTGRFNSHLAGKVLIFMDEGSWTQDKYGAGILRALITESQITIEGKGRDAISMDNHCHLIIAANEDYVVPVGMDDERRMAVIDVGKGSQRDLAYFKKIESEMENGGYEALLYFLQNYEYSEELVRTIPKTEALLDQKLYSMKLEIQWWYERLTDEKIGDFILDNEIEGKMEAAEFYKSYLDFCEIMRSIPLTSNALPKKLKKYIVLEKIRVGGHGGQVYNYKIPTLNHLRKQFEEAIGQRVSWPIVEKI
jgi:hypothetical protein